MKQKIFFFLVFFGLLVAAGVLTAAAVSGAAFTTFNAHVDGSTKDVCKNSDINCNIYGAKEYVWLNGGPSANGLGPDGNYFFAVLVPGGQPNPNDGGAKNLSDDYDTYTNRIFTVTDGEVSAYSGTHWLDSGRNEPGPGDDKPNGLPPYIRLFPYADTTNPGGVYIMAICSLDRGYPVEPRDCKYDAFKVIEHLEYSFMLSGMKFEDLYADGMKDFDDPGLKDWEIIISGTGPDGNSIYAQILTDENGYWEYNSPTYIFEKGNKPVTVDLTVCEELKTSWTQSFPSEGYCYTLNFLPSKVGFDWVPDLDFGNWYPVDVTACKENYYGGMVPNWPVGLSIESVVVDWQVTLEDGCYTWEGLTPGFVYDVHEGTKSGWRPIGQTEYVFPIAASGESYTFTFVNEPLQGCTPGFWQGGNDFGNAGGKWYWNEGPPDPNWAGNGTNPYIWTTLFNSYFTPVPGLDGKTMMDIVGTGGGPDDYNKAARDLVAAYLNANWGIAYAYTPGQLVDMWDAAVVSGNFLELHVLLDGANNAPLGCPISASIPQ